MALSTREGRNLLALVPFWDYRLRVRVIAVSSLIKFWARYPESEQALKAWYAETKSASWRSPVDVKALYRSASVLKKGRVVINIAGNNYRLVVAIAYKAQIVFIKFVGTHKEYDRIEAQTVEHLG
jgi:mRNA interferase HigB